LWRDSASIFLAEPYNTNAQTIFYISIQAQLQRALKEYQTYYNGSRPHQGIDQKIPDLPKNRAIRLQGSEENKVSSKPVLEGLHHDYFRAAA
jgi:hypothetical protein